jgi:hypothetical protein
MYCRLRLFPVPQGETKDPDEGNMAGAAVRQALGKVKDPITGHEHEPTER